MSNILLHRSETEGHVYHFVKSLLLVSFLDVGILLVREKCVPLIENKPKQDESSKNRPISGPNQKQGTPTVSAVFSDGQIVELVFDPLERRTRFVVWQDGAWNFEKIVRTPAGERLIPYSAQNNLIKKEVVLFPTEPCEYGS